VDIVTPGVIEAELGSSHEKIDFHGKSKPSITSGKPLCWPRTTIAAVMLVQGRKEVIASTTLSALKRAST
jgi:hypothetical protein